MRCYPRKLCRRPPLSLILIFGGILRCLFASIWSSQSSQRVADVISNCGHTVPICVDNLLNRDHYHYVDWARGIANSSRLTSTSKHGCPCRLMSYTGQQAVACFDVQAGADAGQTSPKVHFVFIGDSRMRQQFFYFLKLVPDYDRIASPVEIPRNAVPFHHGDVDVESHILGVRVSFKWRPIINDTVVETIRQWTLANGTQRPDWILISMQIYHMMQDYGADHRLYQERLARLAPVLNQLASVSRVIWLNQYPAVELYSKTGAKNTDIHTQKIERYNDIVRRTFKNFKSIRIWDSGGTLAEEYVRSCRINAEREYPNPFFVQNGKDSFINCRPYINCLDYVHTGYVALSGATQLLYNDVCNVKIIRSRRHHYQSTFSF